MLVNTANKIIKILAEKGMTQIELARRAHMPDAQLNRIINGVNIPRLDTALRICQALDCPIEKVFALNKEEKAA